jgi:hypothetical protein
MTDQTKIERLAGMPGEPESELTYGGDWLVAQAVDDWGIEQIYGPYRKSEQAAIRAWNAMVRRIRKANAGGLIDD